MAADLNGVDQIDSQVDILSAFNAGLYRSEDVRTIMEASDCDGFNIFNYTGGTLRLEVTQDGITYIMIFSRIVRVGEENYFKLTTLDKEA